MADVIGRLVKHSARKKRVPLPSRSTIAAALKDAGIDSSGDLSRNDLVMFLSSLFPDRSSGPPPSVSRAIEGARRDLVDESVEALLALPERRETATTGSTVIPAGVRMTERVSRVSYLVSIDSSDRDTIRYPNPNEFSVILGSKSKASGLMRAFVDVESIELVSVVIPKHTVDGDNVDDFPYIILDIPEVGGIYEGTSMQTTRAFAKLRFKDDLGAYREYRTTDAGERFVKRFTPLRSIDRLTVRFYRPDGTPYEFGTRVKRRSRYVTVIQQPSPSETPKKVPMYFDGEKWHKVAKAGGRPPPETTPAASLTAEQGNGESAAEAAALSPDVLDHLPRSECYLVVRITCKEMQLQTSHLHRQ